MNIRNVYLSTAALLLLASLALAADRTCDLVKPEDANALFQSHLGRGAMARSDQGLPYCEYKAPDDTTMMVGLSERDGRKAFAKHREALAENPGKVDTVPGLGDEACLQIMSAGGGSIAIRRGDSFFVILIASHNRLPVRDGLLQLARKALARL